MSKITNEKELKKKLEINDIKDLKDPKIQTKFLYLIKDKEISIKYAKEVLKIIPELRRAFSEVLKTMDSIGTSLEETKRNRWEVLREIAKSGALSSDQIIEAMKILQEIEKNEVIDYTTIFKRALGILGGLLAMAIVIILSGGKSEPKE